MIIILATWILISGVSAQATGKELIETLKFKPESISKASIIREHEQLNDQFHIPDNREGLTQLAYITPVIEILHNKITVLCFSGTGMATSWRRKQLTS